MLGEIELTPQDPIRTSLELYAAEVAAVFGSPAYRAVLRGVERCGSRRTERIRRLHDICDRACASALKAFLVQTSPGERLHEERLARLCLEWSGLLRVTATADHRGEMTPAEVTTVLTIRLHEALVRDAREGAAAVGGGPPQSSARNSASVDAPEPAAPRRPPPRLTRRSIGPLTISFEAVAVHVRGERLDLSSTEARILGHLAERGFATWDELDALREARTGTSAGTVRVLIHRLRVKLREAGEGLELRTIRGRGLFLDVQEDRHPRASAGLAAAA